MVAHIVCGSSNLFLPTCLTGYIVGVDRGALKLIEKKLDFNVAIGDFDSVSELEFQLIKKKSKMMLKLPENKDVTDCEAALQHVMREGYTQVYLYGTTGGRFDHQFATIGLILKYAKQDVQIDIVDAQNKISVLKSGNYIIDVNVKKYISFFALESTVINLKLQGVKYPLDSYDLSVDDSLCVSNEVLDSCINVSFDSGYLLIVQSSD